MPLPGIAGLHVWFEPLRIPRGTDAIIPVSQLRHLESGRKGGVEGLDLMGHVQVGSQVCWHQKPRLLPSSILGALAGRLLPIYTHLLQ